MAEKLVSYYQFVKEKGGQDAVMRLSMKTAISESRAKTAPDSPELVEKFKEAIKGLVGVYPPA